MNEETRWVIARGGPGGAMLALLSARRGVPATLLELHKDFMPSITAKRACAVAAPIRCYQPGSVRNQDTTA